MIAHRAGFASAVARAWVRLYTLGLPGATRDERRDELASDLWEHAVECALSGRRAGPEILERFLLGVPSDLAWRVQHSRLARAPGVLARSLLVALAAGEAVARWVGRRGLPGLAATCALLLALLGGLVLLSAPSNANAGASPRQLIALGIFLLLGALAVGGGSRLLDARPRLGGALVIAGAAPTGLLLWQMVVAPILAAALCVAVIRRWRDAEGGSRAAPLDE